MHFLKSRSSKSTFGRIWDAAFKSLHSKWLCTFWPVCGAEEPHKSFSLPNSVTDVKSELKFVLMTAILFSVLFANG